MPYHCNLFASGMTAAKFTLEILAAPEEVKFATSFTPSSSERAFAFRSAQSKSLPLHISPSMGDETPIHPNRVVVDSLTLPPRRGKENSGSSGGAGQGFTSKDESPEALVSQPSQDRAAGGEIDFPLPASQGKL